MRLPRRRRGAPAATRCGSDPSALRSSEEREKEKLFTTPNRYSYYKIRFPHHLASFGVIFSGSRGTDKNVHTLANSLSLEFANKSSS